MSEPTNEAGTVSTPAPVVSVSPVVLPAPGRAVDLQVRVSAPVTGSELPVILLSHGHGDPAWRAACDALTSSPDPFGRVESRQA